MKLIVLGCSAAYPGPGGACSGYLVRDGKTNLLVDCGTGVLSNLQRVAGLDQIDGIVISHLHADHFFDLIPYRYSLMRNNIRLTLYLPPGGKKAILKTVSAFDKSPDFFSKYFDIEEYDPKAGMKVGKLSIEFAAVKHYIPAYAMAISGKKRFVYSADSGMCNELAGIARGADLFLCEAARCSQDDGEWGHLLAADAAKLAKKAGAKRLILTHFWPDHDYSKELGRAEKAFGGGLEKADVLSEHAV